MEGIKARLEYILIWGGVAFWHRGWQECQNGRGVEVLVRM